MLLCQADGRPAHLSRVHEALVSLQGADRARLGIVVEHKGRPHLFTYRQVEYLNHLLEKVLGKPIPDGLVTKRLRRLLDATLDASAPAIYKEASSSLALDWTDVASFTHPPGKDGPSADPEAAWGHRRGGRPEREERALLRPLRQPRDDGERGGGAEVPELVREMTLSSCDHDPVPVAVEALTARLDTGALVPGNLLADSGYAHRVPRHFALPRRAAGVSLVVDLHPSDRGPQGTFAGAVLANGNLCCPATPTALFNLDPLPRGAIDKDVAAHDARTAELAAYKLGALSADDADGYHRVVCPAVAGKLRCPLRPASMALAYTRPTVLIPPEHPPACCSKQRITVPASVNAKTRQKHDYPGKAWRRSYTRHSAVERSNARIKDPAAIDVDKGWCRVMGLVTRACSSRSRSSCATSPSSTPSRPARPRTRAGALLASQRRRAAVAARASPRLPGRTPRHRRGASPQTSAGRALSRPCDRHDRAGRTDNRHTACYTTVAG